MMFWIVSCHMSWCAPPRHTIAEVAWDSCRRLWPECPSLVWGQVSWWLSTCCTPPDHTGDSGALSCTLTLTLMMMMTSWWCRSPCHTLSTLISQCRAPSSQVWRCPWSCWWGTPGLWPDCSLSHTLSPPPSSPDQSQISILSYQPIKKLYCATNQR